ISALPRQDESGRIIEPSSPAGRDDGRGVVFLDDERAWALTAPTQLGARDDRGGANPGFRAEEHVPRYAGALPRIRVVEGRKIREGRGFVRDHPKVHEVDGILRRRVAEGALVLIVERGRENATKSPSRCRAATPTVSS